MMDAVIDEVDGRMIRIGDRWLADFASCNYLGFDLDREIIDAIPAYLDDVGHPPELVAAARQPGALRGDRDAPHRAAGERGLARPADDHAHPHVRDPAAGRVGHDLPRLPRAQDDLRRLPGRACARRGGQAVPVRGPRPSRPAAARRARPDASRVHGRRQQHDRQRARHPRLRGRRARARRAALRRRRARLRRHRRARPGRVVRVRLARQQRRPPRRRDLRRHRARRRVLEGLLVAAGLHRLPDRGQGPAQGGRASLPVLGTVAGRLARRRPRGLQRQRAPRRRAAQRAPRPHRAGARLPARGSASIPRTTRASRSSRSRCATTGGSTPSAGCCSTAAST